MKIRTIVSIAATLALSAQAFADAAEAQKDMVYPVHPSKMAEWNAKTGGLVPPPEFAKYLLFLDARAENVPNLAKFAGPAERMLSLAIETKKIELPAEASPQKTAFAAKTGKAGAVILLYERADDPTETAFLEDGVMLVNMEKLKCADPNRFSRRFATEFWRSIGFALGAYASTAQMGSSMQGIFSIGDFDTLKGAGLAPMQVAAISANKSKLGIFSRNSGPYSRACKEGWAPMPTNDVQRAFWNKMQADKERGPSNPITIPPPAKK